MMWQEFEQIAGYEVSYEDYTNYIEPMYMAVEISKQDFVKMIDRKRFEIIPRTEKVVIKEMKAAAKEIYEVWGHRTAVDAECKIEELAREYERRFWNGDGMWVYLNRVYEYPGMRGCSMVNELVLMSKYGEHKRITLVKAA